MARYAIWAADQIYGGLHGMYDVSVEDCNSFEDACDIAEENSFEVMNSFSCIHDELDAEVESEMEYDEEQDEDYVCHEIYHGNVEYIVREINEDAAAGYTTEELNNMYANDPDEFVEVYCVK